MTVLILFLYWHPSPFFPCRLCCPHAVLFLSGANAPERFITRENVRERRRGYEAEGNEHWRTNGKRASAASHTQHAVSVCRILYMYVFLCLHTSLSLFDLVLSVICKTNLTHLKHSTTAKRFHTIHFINSLSSWPVNCRLKPLRNKLLFISWIYLLSLHLGSYYSVLSHPRCL